MLETCASPLVEGVSGNDPKAEWGRGEKSPRWSADPAVAKAMAGPPKLQRRRGGERVRHASHDARRVSHTRLTRAFTGATTIQDAPFGAPPTLRFGVSEGKRQNPDANAPRERVDLGCLTS